MFCKERALFKTDGSYELPRLADGFPMTSRVPHSPKSMHRLTLAANSLLEVFGLYKSKPVALCQSSQVASPWGEVQA